MKQFASECEDFGLRQGFSIGLSDVSSHFSLLNYGGRHDVVTSDSDRQQILSTLYMMLPYLHEKLAETDRSPASRFFPSPGTSLEILSKREKECLLWSAEGKTAYEIGLILNIAESTVNFHLKNTIHALGCSNKTHAVAKAVLLGLLIQPDILFDRWENTGY